MPLEVYTPSHRTDRFNYHQPNQPHSRARGFTCFDYHAHECEHCGTIWEHDPNEEEMLDSHNHNVAHHCPKCGEEQWWIYKGKQPAQCIHNGVQTIQL